MSWVRQIRLPLSIMLCWCCYCWCWCRKSFYWNQEMITNCVMDQYVFIVELSSRIPLKHIKTEQQCEHFHTPPNLKCKPFNTFCVDHLTTNYIISILCWLSTNWKQNQTSICTESTDFPIRHNTILKLRILQKLFVHTCISCSLFFDLFENLFALILLLFNFHKSFFVSIFF